MSIDIPIIIDADDSGIEKLTSAFEGAQDDLKDLGKAGDKAADNLSDSFEKVEDDLKGVSKASDKAADDLKSDMSDAAKKIDRDLTKALKEVEDTAQTTGKGIGKSVKDGTDKAGEGLSELKDESKSTAKEAAASFGSIEDAADALQEVAANAFAGFGPAGMVAGALAAVGIGLAISALTENADKINENKEKVAELGRAMKESGGKLSEADLVGQFEEFGFAIQDTKEFWEVFQEDAVTGFEQIRDEAEKAGVSLKDAFLGKFGSVEDATKVLGILETQLADLESQTDKNANVAGEYGAALDITDPKIRDQIASTEDLRDGVLEHIETLRDAEEIERIRKEAIAGTTEALLEQIAAEEESADATKSAIEAEIDQINALKELSTTVAENGATLDLNTEAGQKNAQQFLDTASAAEENSRKALENGEAQDVVREKALGVREAMILQAEKILGSREAAERYVDSIYKIPGNVKTEVILDAANARNTLDDLTKARTAPLHIRPDGSAVENWFISQQGRKIFVDFAPRGGGQAHQMP